MTVIGHRASAARRGTGARAAVRRWALLLSLSLFLFLSPAPAPAAALSGCAGPSSRSVRDERAISIAAGTKAIDAMPADTMPADTMLADTMLADTMLADTMPADAMLADTRGWVQPVDRAVVDLFRRPASEWGAGNRGWEYATEPGDLVVAVGAGTVTFAGPVAGRGVVSVRHEGGLTSSLTGLDSVAVASGDTVAAGQHVGVARKGLHLGFRREGTYVDPASVFGVRLHAVLVRIPR